MAQLDHLIYRVDDLDQAFDRFSSLGFNVIRGGTHADGASGNCLIIFEDGVYIELFSFLKDSPDHWWHAKSGGWIDFALLPDDRGSNHFVDRVNSHPQATVKYLQPRNGGRQTKDNPPKDVEWLVTFVDAPRPARGRLPFLCEDKTPREWRVPSEASHHSNKASGISSITLICRPTQLAQYMRDLELVFDEKSRLPPTAGQAPAEYPLRQRIINIKSPLGKTNIEVEIREASNEAEEAWIRRNGEGLFAVSLHAGEDKELETGLKLCI